MTRGRSFGPAHRTLALKVRFGRPGFAARGSPKFRLGRVESPVRATVVSAPPDREAPGFPPKLRSSNAVLYRNFGRSPRFRTEISVDHRDFKPKLRRRATETSVHGAAFAPRRPPRERSCGRDGPAAYRSSPERVCPRVVPKGRADRDRNGQTPHARAPAGADVMPVGRVSAAPIARSLCRSGVRTTLRARGRLQAVAAGA